MIEVLFGESEAASMKVAKSKKSLGKSGNGPMATIGKKQAGKNETVRWVPGASNEVICLGYMLDIGDLKLVVESDYRKNLIFSMLYQEQYGGNQEMKAELREAGSKYDDEFRRLETFLEAGESIRIWYSNTPYSLCGLYFLCDFLREYSHDIFVVELPSHKVKGQRIISYQNWGEVAAEEFGDFLEYERQLRPQVLQLYAAKWKELVKENRPLRAVVNGQLMGVPVEFYDFLIWGRLTKAPIKQARLIGDILGNYPIAIGDWWYASRIEAFVKVGKIKVLEDSEKKYARTIGLA